MNSTTCIAKRPVLVVFAGAMAAVIVAATALAAEDGQEEKPKLLGAAPEELAARQKQLVESAPDGGRLVAYLDCGSQWQSGGNDQGSPVKIVCMGGKPYRFQSEAAGVPSTQARIFFKEDDIVFDITGLDPRKQYRAGITWWDYDNGGRTQSVLAASPNRRMVRFAVPCIRLPDYETSGRLPGERRFSLPATFLRDGKMQLIVQRLAGANTVISEVWIWEMP